VINRGLNKLYTFFLFSIVVSFFYLRPLNSEWFRIITADGLGYYSYLPAKFIYHDKNLNFQWFNEVYPKYYAYNSFSVPDENILVEYKDKRINKYYPGQSFLCLPFFLAAHLLSKLLGLPADGFSLLYQVFMGLAAVFYSCLGLWYLRKLLFNLFANEWLSCIVPILIFFGTNLFSYTVYYGCFSHAFSFAFIVMALYFARLFSVEEENKLKYLVLFSLCFLIVVFIRPLNILFVLAVPAVMNNYKFSLRGWSANTPVILWGIIILFLLYWQFSILYKQTGSFFPATYTNEKFHFDRPHISDILFSYHAGWFVYVPLALTSLLGLLFIKHRKKFILFFILIATVVVLYGCWWYWSIFTRTIVDFTGILAILLCFFLFQIYHKKRMFRTVFTVCILCVFYFQLKAYQFRNGILDNNYTYSDYYWNNFFETRPVYNFPVHPKTIIKQTSYTENFEADSLSYSSSEKYEGNKSLLLKEPLPLSPEYSYIVPPFLQEKGYKKIRTTFRCKVDGDMEFRMVYRFLDDENREIIHIPVYIKTTPRSGWQKMEFGCDLPPEAIHARRFAVSFINLDKNRTVNIDILTTEFFLTDNSMEMVP